MTLSPLHVPASGDVDTAGTDAVGRIGREIIGQVDLDHLAALIERRPASALLEELAGIVRALELAGAPGGRRAGIVGRLLGRDLAVQARAREAHEHVRIRFRLAERRAADVVQHARELDDAIAHVQRQRARLAEIAARGRSALDAFELATVERPDAMERRLDHLAVLLSSWDVAVAHLRLVREYAGLLLARYAHVRDVVMPRWQRQVEAADDDAAAHTDLLREAVASLLQATAPQAVVQPLAGNVRV